MDTLQKIDLEITDEDILEFFWIASENGWYNENTKYEKDPHNRNKKRFIFKSGSFVYIDEYWVTPFSNKSAGTTTILYEVKGNLIPVWWMSYQGEYNKGVIPLLKLALQENIRLKKFEGGRGPNRFENYMKHMNLLYRNKVSGNFSKFKGREEIVPWFEERELGYHSYQGMSLL